MIKQVGAGADQPEGATMHTMKAFLALTMVAACGGVEGLVLYPSNDGAADSNSGGNGGSTAGTGGTVGTGGLADGMGGTVAGTGGAMFGTGGSVDGTGGIIGPGSGGSGGSAPDGSIQCSSWTTEADCRRGDCMLLAGRKNGAGDSIFFGCSGPCPAVMSAAYPPGEPDNCYMFGSACIPPGWTRATSYCPTVKLLPTITALTMGINCMPGPPSQLDKLVGTFDVKYDNTGGNTASLATIKSAWLSWTDTTTHTAAFAVIPADSGSVPAGASVVVAHRKDINSQTGLGCACNPPLSVMLNVTWEIDGQSVNGSFGPSTLGCSY